MEKFCFGKIVKLHGVLGQVKIATKLDSGFDLGKITSFFNENDDVFAVNRIFKVTDGVVATLDGVNFETAKSMIGTWLYIDRSLLDGKIMFEDLKGSEVYLDDKTLLGKIVDVQDFGSAEILYVINSSGRELLVPNVPNLIVSYDYKTKKLVIKKSVLSEVCEL